MRIYGMYSLSLLITLYHEETCCKKACFLRENITQRDFGLGSAVRNCRMGSCRLCPYKWKDGRNLPKTLSSAHVGVSRPAEPKESTHHILNESFEPEIFQKHNWLTYARNQQLFKNVIGVRTSLIICVLVGERWYTSQEPDRPVCVCADKVQKRNTTVKSWSFDLQTDVDSASELVEQTQKLLAGGDGASFLVRAMRTRSSIHPDGDFLCCHSVFQV